jgi:phytoene/squalene synthetase
LRSKKESLKRHNLEAYLATQLFIKGEKGKLANLLYTYLRWVDDFVDDNTIESSRQKEFLSEHLNIIDHLYNGYKFRPENYFEEAISEVVKYDIKNGYRLKTVIYKMFEVFDFDIKRKNKFPDFTGLNEYSKKIGDAYTRALLFFLAPGLLYKEDFSLSAYASHQVHLLRDFLIDKENGYFNISGEEIKKYNIKEDLIQDENFAHWVKDKIANIKFLIEKGKREFRNIPILRVRLTGYLYCFRYQRVIRRIEKDHYKLR